MDREEAQPLYDRAIHKIGYDAWMWRVKAAAFDCSYETFKDEDSKQHFMRVWLTLPGGALAEEVHRISYEEFSGAKVDLIRQKESQLRLRAGRLFVLVELGILPETPA